MSLVAKTPRELAIAAEVGDAHVRAQWDAALAVGDPPPPAMLSLFDDWSAFSGQDYRALLERVFSAYTDAGSEWDAKQPSTPLDVADFYGETATMVPMLLWWHGTNLGPARCAVGASSVLRCVGARSVLDFGCGIGSTALVLAHAGLRVTLADVSQEALDFSRRRLDRRGRTYDVLDLRSSRLDTLPDASFEGVVAFDVFEHIPFPERDLARLDRLLAPEGLICLNQLYVPEEDSPAHYPQHGELLQWLHAHGYRLAHVRSVCWIAQKAPLGGVSHRRQGAALRARVAGARVADGLDGSVGRRLGHHLARLTLR